MAFAEDMTAFFSAGEFAVLAVFTPSGGAQEQAAVIFDTPTDDVLGGNVLSQEYAMTYPASAMPSVRTGDYGAIGGERYRIRELRLVGDGGLKRAKLSKV